MVDPPFFAHKDHGVRGTLSKSPLSKALMKVTTTNDFGRAGPYALLEGVPCFLLSLRFMFLPRSNHIAPLPGLFRDEGSMLKHPSLRFAPLYSVGFSVSIVPPTKTLGNFLYFGPVQRTLTMATRHLIRPPFLFFPPRDP